MIVYCGPAGRLVAAMRVLTALFGQERRVATLRLGLRVR